jgi:hypothetical protein
MHVSLRDRFVTLLEKSQAGGGKPFEGPAFTTAARFSLLLDAIKLIGAGNGAGTLGSVAALYYFASRPELHGPMKAAAICFGAGLIIFALSIPAFIFGLFAATDFLDRYTPVTDASKVPWAAINRGIDGLMFASVALLGALLSWTCFMIGTSIGLYAVIRLA